MKLNAVFFLIGFAITLHLFFYLSSFSTHTLDYFFPWGNVHEWQGIDFYQVPNGAFSFLHGGKLIGETINQQAYSFGNTNVYHPFFTLTAGSFLQLFSPHDSFIVLAIIKLILTFYIAVIVYKRFKKHAQIYFAFFIYFTFFPQYLEIWNGQYHFFLALAVFYILWNYTSKNNSHIVVGISYFLALLVKPIGVVWIPFLLIKRQWKVLGIGIALFIITTIPFIVTQTGMYYITNIIDRIQNPIGGPPGIFTLDALLRYYAFTKETIMLARYGIFSFLLFVQLRYKPNIFQSFFIWAGYYLLFYDLVFEYHYTILIPFFLLGVLTQKIFQSKKAKALILSFSFPTPFFIFHYFQFYAINHKVTNDGWVILVLFRIIPLIALCGMVILHLFTKKYIKKI